MVQTLAGEAAARPRSPQRRDAEASPRRLGRFPSRVKAQKDCERWINPCLRLYSTVGTELKHTKCFF